MPKGLINALLIAKTEGADNFKTWYQKDPNAKIEVGTRLKLGHSSSFYDLYEITSISRQGIIIKRIDD